MCSYQESHSADPELEAVGHCKVATRMSLSKCSTETKGVRWCQGVIALLSSKSPAHVTTSTQAGQSSSVSWVGFFQVTHGLMEICRADFF